MNRTYINEAVGEAKFEEATTGKTGYRILGKLQAPFFDLNGATRNGRDYSEAAEAALESDMFKERINNRVFFGRLGHPMTDDESAEDPAVRACVIMTDYKKNNSTNMYEGTLEILDNQYGRQLKSLIDAGCRMGVSTRGSGDSYTEANGNEKITKGTYDFEALDVVTMPAVKSARVTVLESVSKDKRVALENLVKSSNDKYVLESLKTTLESSGHPKRDELLEEINKKLATGGTGTTDSLANDITEVASKLAESEARNSELQKKLDEALQENKSLRESKVPTETIERKDESVSESTKKLVNLLRSGTQIIESMKKSMASKDARYESLRAKTQQSVSTLDSYISKEKARVKRLEELEAECTKLRSMNESLKTKVTKLESDSKKTITESFTKSDEVKKLHESVSSLTEKLKKYESSNASLTESLKSHQSALNNAMKKYIESSAMANRIRLSDLRAKVNESSTIQEIDAAAKSIREDMDRRAEALPDITSLGKRISESQIPQPKSDPELDRAAMVARLTSTSNRS